MRLLLLFPNSPIVSDPCCEGYNTIKIPPHELLSVAAYNRSRHHVSVLDAKAEGLSLNQIEAKICSIKPDLTVVWSFTMTYLRDIEALKIAKKHASKTVLVLNPPILLQQIAQRFDFIDFIIWDERPFIISEILDAMQNKTDFSKISGIVFRSNNQIIDTGKPSPRDYAKVPTPAYDLAPMHLYNKTITSVISTRGCPFQCSFCVWGRSKWRAKDVSQIVDEVSLLVNRYGYRNIGFPDQHFTLDKQRVYDFCDAIIEKNLKFNWGCDSRVEAVEPELLKRMHRAGCTRIFFGVEHINEEILRLARKNQNKQQVLDAAKMSHDAGIHFVAPFIIGLPGETWDTIKELKDFIIRLKPFNYHILPPVPYPGTELYQQAKENGWLLIEEKPENFWLAPDFSHPLMAVPPLTAKDLLKARRMLQILPRLNPVIFINTMRDIYGKGGILKFAQIMSGAFRLIANKPR